MFASWLLRVARFKYGRRRGKNFCWFPLLFSVMFLILLWMFQHKKEPCQNVALVSSAKMVDFEGNQESKMQNLMRKLLVDDFKYNTTYSRSDFAENIKMHLNSNPKSKNHCFILSWEHYYTWSAMGYYIALLKSISTMDAVSRLETPLNILFNHMPGIGYITEKQALSQRLTNQYLSGHVSDNIMPVSFNLPQDVYGFEEYSESHPHTVWVKKSHNHRGVVLADYNAIKDMNSNTQKDKLSSTLQRFITQPALVDGFKFDIGVYVLLINHPNHADVQFFIYTTELLLRFCSLQYDKEAILSAVSRGAPNDIDRDMYVIGDNYRPVDEVPSLKSVFLDNDGSHKEVFDSFMPKTDTAKASSTFFDQVESTIVALNSENVIREGLRMKPKARNEQLPEQLRLITFDLVRMDFVIDMGAGGKPLLLEVNMSPNMDPSAHPKNAFLYTDVQRSTIQLLHNFAQQNHGHAFNVDSKIWRQVHI